ncbi:phage late control D family protein [Pseudoxanthomonas sp. PXM02]|uniref:phage late control D family protein n=1 Tax=Pseudoxanthomonas sp. PXM02 TaxID=2769294 RepID=UPI00178737A2|nr:phage late control D family protein [Pseudoxanthomonas sp. PXM02]MBD9478530.1 phage late control D family protein [Pseudoxanthomonas sp. PXM02]
MSNEALYAIPAWKVVLDGKDLTERFRPRLLDLTLTECRGGEADQLELRIHDHDGAVAMPRKGVLLQVSLGWQDSGLIDKGTFKVDEVEHSGTPDVITVRARSADLTQQMRTRRDRSWHATTLGKVVRNIAGEHGLQPRIAAPLDSIAIAHLDQTEESDANLLTRLAKRYDAVATVKAGALLFAPIGSGKTATGKPLPGASITRDMGDQHRYMAADRDVYTGVRAYWHDKGAAQRKSVVVGQSGNAKRLRESYANEAEAREQATAEWNRIRRGGAKFSITLALGRADLYPEQRIDVAGFKEGIDGEWLASRVVHTVTGSAGFTTALDLETVGSESSTTEGNTT